MPSPPQTYSCSITIQSTEAGNTFYARVRGGDVAGNGMGAWVDGSETLTVINNAGVDEDPPVVSNITLSTTSVDVTSSSQVVTVSAYISDESDIQYMNFYLYAYDGSKQLPCQISGASSAPSSLRLSILFNWPAKNLTVALSFSSTVSLTTC